MAYFGLNFKVSKHSKNEFGATFKLFYAKKGLKKPCIKLTKRQTIESGGNANFKKAKWPPLRFSMAAFQSKFV